LINRSVRADHAELEAPAKIHRRPGAARHLNAASPDVDDHRHVTREAYAIDGRKVNESRLFGPGDNPRADSGLLGHGLEEIAAVFGLACGAGRHRDHLVHAMGFRQPPELRQNLQRGVHRLWRERPAVEAPGAKADHFLFPVNHLEGQVGAQLDHDHVDRVGADVDGR
jgi:hypothetical protein